MPLLPTNPNTTQNKIDAGFAEVNLGRGYMGMSGIGNPCLRAMQLTFRMSTQRKITHRISRIFNTGHNSEHFMIADLKRIGIDVWGEQEELIGFAGHWKGHIDGRCIGVIEAPKTEHLLEMKTHNDKSFNDLKKKGVKESKPGHYAQMTEYMGYTGLKRALYLAYNKNNSEYWIERVYFDKEYFEELRAKERYVVLEELPAARIGTNRPSWYECKFCDHSDVCFKNIEPFKSCGSCQYRDVYDDGVFKCGFNDYNNVLTWDEQIVGCKHYRKSDFYAAL